GEEPNNPPLQVLSPQFTAKNASIIEPGDLPAQSGRYINKIDVVVESSARAEDAF
nr:hypothetical protein [Tanacetum cinerariifolium]